jgi:FimV-like protein
MIDLLMSALQGVGMPPTTEDLRDILWLLQRVPPSPPEVSGSAGQLGQSAQFTRSTPATASNQADGASRSEVGTPTTPTDEVGLYAPGQMGRIHGGVLRVPGVTAFPRHADLRRVLQPLARRVPSTTRWQLDEEGTAEARAETGQWHFIHRRPRERWFNFQVVIDRSPSMDLWQQEIDWFMRGVKSHGRFRSFDVFELGGGDHIQLRRKGGHRPIPTSTLVSAGQRSTTLVLTDGSSTIWQTGRAQHWLYEVAARTSVAVMQLLQRRAWRHTALGGPEAGVRWTTAGSANKWLRVSRGELDDAPSEQWCPMPLLGSEPASILNWARAVTAHADAWLPAIWVPASQDVAVQLPERAVSPAERVAQFRRKASPAAYDLAVFLSVPDPLTLPVMRLVQRAMLPDTSTAELAEFLLGGLVISLPVVDGARAWRLHEGVRDELIGSLRYSEERHIAEQLRLVGQAIERAHESDSYFEAWFPSPQGGARLSEWSVPFATVSRAILQGEEATALTPPESTHAQSTPSIPIDDLALDLEALSPVPEAESTSTLKPTSEDLPLGDALRDVEPVTMSEVGTKLDLARAYMDMGDPDGARNILEEVLQEGSQVQRQEAQRLIESLPEEPSENQ